ncbi:hypothetical protein AVEN_93967-1 [Araneus ventricosus]|uniref:Uncharacterized protein n=1 Tax=Araneus ventricosus TaxID=182803 RepID=A0A4Y2CKW4_ARAVE|nr:hypothetical protein AVEN_93967-1 [Araneus ventricosus]
MLSDDVILSKTQELLQKFKWEICSHHVLLIQQAPNLGSKHLNRTRFYSNSDMKTVAEKWLNEQGPHFYQAGLNKLVLRSDNAYIDLVIIWKSDRQVRLLIPFCIFCLLSINNFLRYPNTFGALFS